MKKALRILGWIAAILFLLLVIQVLHAGWSRPVTPEISYSEFLSRVTDGQVKRAVIICNMIHGYDSTGGSFLVIGPTDQTAMLETLRQRSVEIWFQDAPKWPTWVLYLIALLLVGLLIVVYRQRRKIKRLEAVGMA